MSCDICCEKFNKSTFLKVECKGCIDDKFACRTCCKTYILNSQTDPQCLFCKTVWDREFMNNFLTKKFVQTELKTHSENLFLERQMSLLPDTQRRASQIKKSRELTDKRQEIFIELQRLKDQIRSLTDVAAAYTLEINRLLDGTSSNIDSTAENFSFKCPNDKCKGFLNSKHFCNLCDTPYCKDCMCIKNKDHTCDASMKETVSYIKKSSKPCPGCGEMISKIDGCDQMWCIKCHIQFSWRTGSQITGYNHNPEYFRWLRETNQMINRNPNEIRECDPLNINEFELMIFLRNIFATKQSYIDYYINVYRFYRHIAAQVRNLPRENDIFENELLNLRVGYLLGDISKETWKVTLQRIDKKNKLTTSNNNLWRLTETVLVSLLEELKNLLTSTSNILKYDELKTRLNNFKEYVNENFIKISNVFGSTTCPGIDKDWFQIYNYKEYLRSKLPN